MCQGSFSNPTQNQVEPSFRDYLESQDEELPHPMHHSYTLGGTQAAPSLGAGRRRVKSKRCEHLFGGESMAHCTSLPQGAQPFRPGRSRPWDGWPAQPEGWARFHPGEPPLSHMSAPARLCRMRVTPPPHLPQIIRSPCPAFTISPTAA
jgi:hypothetical protein